MSGISPTSGPSDALESKTLAESRSKEIDYHGHTVQKDLGSTSSPSAEQTIYSKNPIKQDLYERMLKESPPSKQSEVDRSLPKGIRPPSREPRKSNVVVDEAGAAMFLFLQTFREK